MAASRSGSGVPVGWSGSAADAVPLLGLVGRAGEGSDDGVGGGEADVTQRRSVAEVDGITDERVADGGAEAGGPRIASDRGLSAGSTIGPPLRGGEAPSAGLL